MNPKDLIVGLSQVYFNCKVHTIEIDDLLIIKNGCVINETPTQSISLAITADKLYRPIPLSTEILEKIGKLKQNKIFEIEISGVGFKLSLTFEDNFCYPCLIESFREVSLDPIQHLHELQQLIWVLFKKEVRV